MSAGFAGVILLGSLAACGSDSTPEQTTSPAATASSTADCTEATALKDSLDALTKVKPLEDGVASLNAAIADVKSSLDAAVASAEATVQPEVEQVKTAFASLQTAATGLTADNIVEKLPDISAALVEVSTATTTLGSSLTQNCVTS